MFRIIFLFCWRISMGSLALELWLLGGAWFQQKCRGFWADSHLLMFPGVRISMIAQSSGVEPLASGFHFSVHTELKTNPQVNAETTLHSQEHPRRFTELYREEKRGEGERGDKEEKKGGSKGKRAIKTISKSLSEN